MLTKQEKQMLVNLVESKLSDLRVEVEELEVGDEFEDVLIQDEDDLTNVKEINFSYQYKLEEIKTKLENEEIIKLLNQIKPFIEDDANYLGIYEDPAKRIVEILNQQ